MRLSKQSFGTGRSALFARQRIRASKSAHLRAVKLLFPQRVKYLKFIECATGAIFME